MGRAHDADVGAAHLGLAEPEVLARLEEAQERDLDVGRQLADLVEEERAGVGRLDEAGAVGVRAGEGAAAVAEQLRERELGAHGAAVDGDERPAGAAALRVDRAGDQLLAGAGLADQDDREVGAGGARHEVGDAGHRARRADEARVRKLAALQAALAMRAHRRGATVESATASSRSTSASWRSAPISAKQALAR